MKLYLSPKASYLYQALKSKSVPYAEQVKALFRDIQAHPQEGIGTPEMIDASLPGYWERRFNGSGMVTYYSEGDYVIIISIMNELLPSYEELPFKLQEASKEDYAQIREVPRPMKVMTPEEHAKAHELGLPHDHGEHAGGHAHHGHVHSHTQTKAVLNRMSRLIGHLEAIKRMVEEGRDCSEVLVQLSAVRSAINGVSKIILKDHLEHCVVDAVKENDKDAIAQLNKAIDQFMK